jgi:hypothetical protein
MSAFGLLPDLFENVLHRQTGPQERHSAEMHQLKKVPASAIHAGDALQVYRDAAFRLSRLGRPPAVFKLGDKGARQSTLYSEYYGLARFLDFNLHHRLGTAIQKGKFLPKP